MNFNDFFTPTVRVVRQASRPTPQEQFRDNVNKQIQLLDGEKALSPSGKEVLPTVVQNSDGSYTVAIKFGGAFVKLNGEATHFKVSADQVRPALRYLIEASHKGDFDKQLEEISANIRARLQPKWAGSTVQA